MCVISYFYVVVIKYPNQGNLLEKEFTQVYRSKGVRAIMERSMEKNGRHDNQSRKPRSYIYNHKYPSHKG